MPPPTHREPPVLTNPRADRVKSVRALSRRSVREQTGRFVVEGPQGVREASLHRPGRSSTSTSPPRPAPGTPTSSRAAEAADLHVHEVTDEVLAAMADTPHPKGSPRYAAWSPPRSTTCSRAGRACSCCSPTCATPATPAP